LRDIRVSLSFLEIFLWNLVKNRGCYRKNLILDGGRSIFIAEELFLFIRGDMG